MPSLPSRSIARSETAVSASATASRRVVSDVARLSTHPQLRRMEVAHESGSVALPVPAVSADWDVPRPIPALDEHGEAIRAEFA